MPIPKERTGVPANRVKNLKKIMLQNPKVKEVKCIENADGTYDLKPVPR